MVAERQAMLKPDVGIRTEQVGKGDNSKRGIICSTVLRTRVTKQ